MSGQHTETIIYVVISKNYDISALSDNKDLAYRFAVNIGGLETCYIIETLEEKLDMSENDIADNMLFVYENIIISHKIDMRIENFSNDYTMKFFENISKLMDLSVFYKFNDNEKSKLRILGDIEESFTISDISGFPTISNIDIINYSEMFRLYLASIRRNKNINMKTR